MNEPELQGRGVVGRVASAALTVLLLAAAASARAQAPTDARWQAWIGCWSPVNGAAAAATGKAPVVCVIPGGNGGVDVVTVVDTQIVSRDPIAVTGERRAVERAGCTGWETAHWSSEGQRVYRQSEYVCPGDVKRSTSELIAVTPSWEWLDVQGLSAHGGTGVRVLRYRTTAVPAVPEIASALTLSPSDISMARGMAAAPPSTADVVEASHQGDPAVVEAWLAEEGAGFPLNGKALLGLADAGVPPRVIDVMVAMSYPKVFTVAAPSTQGEFAPVDASRRLPGVDTSYAYRQPYYGSAYAPYGWDYYSPYSWSPYGYYSPYGYTPFGYNPYGPMWGGGYFGGGYYGGGTIVIVPNSGTGGNPPKPHGRVVNGRGYTRSSGGNGNAQPETRRSSGSSGSGSSSSPSSSGRSSSSGSGSSQAGQKAHPRP
jgi:hypothetical protein